MKKKRRIATRRVRRVLKKVPCRHSLGRAARLSAGKGRRWAVRVRGAYWCWRWPSRRWRSRARATSPGRTWMRLRRTRAVSLGPRVRDARSRSGRFPPGARCPAPRTCACRGRPPRGRLRPRRWAAITSRRSGGMATTTRRTGSRPRRRSRRITTSWTRTTSRGGPTARSPTRWSSSSRGGTARRTNSRRLCPSRGASRRWRRSRPRRTTRRLGRTGSIAATRARFLTRRRNVRKRNRNRPRLVKTSARTRRLFPRRRAHLPR